MKLHPISVSQLQQVESGTFLDRFFTDFEDSGLSPATNPEFAEQFDSLRNQLPTYKLALVQIRAREESVELSRLDTIRDHKFTVVRRANSVFEYADDETELTAYRTVDIILRKYKNVEKSNYETESLNIEFFVRDVRAAKEGAMDTLGLKRYIDQLEEANENFRAKFNTRSSENVSTAVYDVKMLRRNIFETYSDLVTSTYLTAKRKNSPYYVSLMSVINNGRAYFADIIAKRAAINKRDDASE